MASSYKYPFGELIETKPINNTKHDATAIMLHGLGDTGHGWSFAGQHMALPGVKWVFPTAPTRPISCNMGMAMPGWFDIKTLPLDPSEVARSLTEAEQKEIAGKHVDDGDVGDSVRYLLELVEKERNEHGIPPERVVLGGFSQGGHVAARAALEAKASLAGCVVLSSWVGGSSSSQEVSPDLPFFLGHGEADPMVPLVLSQKSNEVLSKKGVKNVTYRTYRGIGHSCSAEELDDVKDFLVQCLSAKGKGATTTTTHDTAEYDWNTVSIGKLKRWLVSKNVDVHGCLEKTDLVAKAKASSLDLSDLFANDE